MDWTSLSGISGIIITIFFVMTYKNFFNFLFDGLVLEIKKKSEMLDIYVAITNFLS